MARFDLASPTVASTAGTLVVSTRDCILYGVCAVAGATATVGAIVVHAANTTGSTVFGMTTLTSGGMVQDGPYAPVLCSSGMVVTCTGTAFNFTVYFTNLHP